MTGFDSRKQSPQGDKEPLEAGPLVPDSGPLAGANFLIALGKDNPDLATNGTGLETQSADPSLVKAASATVQRGQQWIHGCPPHSRW